MEPVSNATSNKPIINCHTHVFIGDHVPPYLAKTFVPWPLYYLLPLSLIVKLFRFWLNGPGDWPYKGWYKRLRKVLYQTKIFIVRNIIVRLIAFVVGTWLTIHAFLILFDWLAKFTAPDSKGAKLVTDARLWLEERNLLFIPESVLWKLGIIAVVFLFVKAGRNLIIFLFKKLWKFFGMLPGPQTKELIKRYINIGRFSFHKQQAENFKRLRNQYPPGTGFVVLPMDMEYMKAGGLKQGFKYRDQMAELATIKKNLSYRDRFFPFVFVEPRRMAKEADYFVYRLEGEQVVLENCFVKEYIEEHGFNGFKIYPALGYYPFDEALLPVWKYAADHGLPILTHCIRGNIYYRGAKKKEWDYHPVFEQAAGDGVYEPLLLHQMKNIEFINNFTHPLNYLCLLEEKLLRKLVSNSKDARIKTMFGYTDDVTPLTSNLSHLKICFGHFGGDDEWKKFMELDRDNYSSQLIKKPAWGIDFLTDDNGVPRPGKIEQIWRGADWYTIICSLMLQYNNVYADLSYILHDLEIRPLLKQTMLNERLNKKVLFGTDFYVVRNHKSEKHMLAEMVQGLSVPEFDLMARQNPRMFLKKTNIEARVELSDTMKTT